MDDDTITEPLGNEEPTGEPSADAGADAGSTGDAGADGSAVDPSIYTVREPGKRGRHPNGCNCERCAAKRSGGLGQSEPVRTTSSKSGKQKTAPLAVETFGKQIVGAHAIAALLLKSPIIAINDVQGQELAIAIKDLAAQYDIKPNPKTMAWIKMAGVSAMVYGPKLMLVAQAQKLEREKRQSQKPAFMPDMQPAPKPPAPANNGSMGGIQFPDPFGRTSH